MQIINPINECKLFDTPTSYNDLLRWCESMSGSEKVVAITAMHMALNLAHHIVQQAINKDMVASTVEGAFQ